MRKQQPSGEIITVSAADPLNLVGILVPGDRVASNSGRSVSFRDGVALLPEERPTIIPISCRPLTWSCGGLAAAFTASTALHRQQRTAQPHLTPQNFQFPAAATAAPPRLVKRLISSVSSAL